MRLRLYFINIIIQLDMLKLPTNNQNERYCIEHIIYTDFEFGICIFACVFQDNTLVRYICNVSVFTIQPRLTIRKYHGLRI